jgi:mannitol-specific phosphotransferase system IIBC component
MYRLATAAAIGQVVGLLGWIDAIYIPFVLAAPIITGAIAGSKGVSYTPVAVVWASAGLCMLWTDWLVNREDVVFHLATSIVMPMLAGLGWMTTTWFSRRRTPERVSAGSR